MSVISLNNKIHSAGKYLPELFITPVKIRFFTGLLQYKNDKISPAVAHILEELKRTGSVYEEMLNKASGLNQKSIFDITILFDEIIHKCKDTINKKCLTCEKDYRFDTPVFMDRKKMLYFFQGLIEHVINYTDDGGKISIEVIEKSYKTIEIKLESTGESYKTDKDNEEYQSIDIIVTLTRF